MKVVVIIPAFNEERSIKATIDSINQSIAGVDILVIDNASTDKTAEIVQKCDVKILHEHRKGKGYAISTGFAATLDYDAVVMIDGDNTYDLSKINVMIDMVANGYDMVVGDRISSNDSFGRKGHQAGNKFFSWLFNALLDNSTKDPFSGLRVFSKRFVGSFAPLSSGFEIESEMNMHAHEHGFKVADVDIVYNPRSDGSVSKLRTVRDGTRILLHIIYTYQRKCPLRFYSAISLPFMAFGLLGFASVYMDYLASGVVLKTPSLMTYLSILVFSFLTLLFGLLNENINKHFTELKRRAR